MSRCCAFLLLAGLSAPVRGGSFSSAARGTSAAEFLKLGAGARAAAMGEAYAAVADDATALYWNPGALTRIPTHSATFMHAPYIESSFFNYAAYGRNLDAMGSVAGGLQHFSAGSISETDETGRTVGDFSPADLALSAGYARRLEESEPLEFLEGMSAGVAVKYVHSRILDSAQTAAVDLGLLSRAFLDDRLRLAFTAANLGGGMRFEGETEPLPTSLRFGGAYQLRRRWLAGLDLALPRDNNPVVALGTECLAPIAGPWRLAGRAGFNSRTSGDVDGVTGLSFGFGLGYQKMTVDYALAPMGNLGLTQRISLSIAL